MLETSIADYDALVANQPQFKPSQAHAGVSLAKVLLRLDETAIVDARSLLVAAAEFSRGAGPAFARRLGHAERLAARASIDGPGVCSRHDARAVVCPGLEVSAEVFSDVLRLLLAAKSG